MASFNRPVPYNHYPSSASAQHADRPVPDDGPGSFGPVLVVMAVILFLAVAACVAGRLCGRGSPTTGSSSGQQRAEADKGLSAEHLEVMRPLPSSRASVHDMDDAFEIRLVPQKPAGSEANGGGFRLQALPLLQPRLSAPRRYPPAAAGGVDFRIPASNANAGAARQPHLSFVPAQQR